MKNKKAIFLAEETLKIVLSVIVIGFLIYFLVSLYLASNKGDEIEFAESSVRYIIDQINIQASEIQIFNPDGWFVTAYTDSAEMPFACSNLNWKNCICICEEGTKESCDKEGYCKDYNKEIFIKEGSIEINNTPITLQLNYGEKIEVNRK